MHNACFCASTTAMRGAHLAMPSLTRRCVAPKLVFVHRFR
jgi:hypothetical protein